MFEYKASRVIWITGFGEATLNLILKSEKPVSDNEFNQIVLSQINKYVNSKGNQ